MSILGRRLNGALIIASLFGVAVLGYNSHQLSKEREALSLLSDKVCQLAVQGEYVSEGNYGQINCYKKVI